MEKQKLLQLGKYILAVLAIIMITAFGTLLASAFISSQPQKPIALKTFLNAQKRLCEARKVLGEANLKDYANKLLEANAEELQHFMELSKLDCIKDF